MSNNIKLSFVPLLFILVLIALALGVGFAWDAIRTKSKLEHLANRSEAIYKAHITEFSEIAAYDDKYKSQLLLNNINTPEKEVYYVSVLRNTPQGLLLVDNQYIKSYDPPQNPDFYQESTFSYEDNERIRKILSDNQTTTTKEALFKNVWWDKYDNLYAFTPIRNGQETVGWVILRLPKTTDI